MISKAPQAKFNNTKEALDAAFTNEQLVTKMIYANYELAQTQKDYAAIPLILWFIEEQVEEEALIEEIVQRYPYFKENDLYWDHRMKRKDFKS